MDDSTYVTLSAQIALQAQLNVVANNVANSSTAGYKADRQLFQSFVTPLKTPGDEVAFVQDRATYLDQSAGAMQTTDNPLDVAVGGQGFLAIQVPGGGRQYTRDGKLEISPDGQLSDSQGRAVLSADGTPIQIPAGSTNIKILGDGSIGVLADGAQQQVGQIGLFRAANPLALRKAGTGLIDGGAAGMSPVDPGDPTTRLVQGSTEGSTVQPVKELANMTELSRAYERLQKLLSDDDSRISNMISQLGKTG